MAILLAPYYQYEQSVVQVGYRDATGTRRRPSATGRVRGAGDGRQVAHRLCPGLGCAPGYQLVASELNKAISQAVREGRLMEDDPLGQSGIKRVSIGPGQPAVRMRQLGPRSFDELPPAELAALLDRVAERDRITDEEALQRMTLEQFGLRRFAENVKSCFINLTARCSGQGWACPAAAAGQVRCVANGRLS